jgi:TonB family protein
MPITVGIRDRIVILPRRFASEVNVELLTSALGHEFQHVARHDYLLNLVYEVLYIPLSFHPAAALVRRRIRHTRELCCDAAVTAASISAEVYARSLVKLIGSAPLLPLAPDTTIGMNESDILEVRIMALLKKSQISLRRRTLLLIVAAVLFLTPCVVAATFAVAVNAQEPSATEARKKVEASQDLAQQERTVVELNRQARELKEKLAQSPTAIRPEVERRLKEVEQNLIEYQRNIELTREKELIAQQSDKATSDALKSELMQKLQAAEQAAAQGDRKVRVISKTEARYTDDARAKGIAGNVILRFMVDQDGMPQDIQVKKSLYPSLDQSAIEAARTWRFEPAMKNGQVVSTWLEVQINFNLYDDLQKKEEARETLERREQQKIEDRQPWMLDGQEVRVRRGSEADRRAEREAEEKRNAVLAGMAKISMDHAIQIANSKVPGKVTECSLVGERWQDPGELAKPSLVLYHVVVLSDEATPVKTHVLINAVDGSVVSVKKENRREEEEMTGEAFTSSNVTRHRPIEGGVLNGKASSLPSPSYPAIARAAHASGDVTIRVVIDEGGNVVEATPVSGHPLLRASAQAAAKEAKFAPTRLNNEPVVVTGTLVYNFVAQ